MDRALPAATRPFDHMSFFVAQLVGGLLLIELFLMGGVWRKLVVEFDTELPTSTNLLIGPWLKLALIALLAALAAKEWLIPDRGRKQLVDLCCLALLLAGHAWAIIACVLPWMLVHHMGVSG